MQGRVIIMGDFNAYLNGEKIQKHLDKRSLCLQQFFNINCYLSVNVLPGCTGASSTLLSYNMMSQSLIDHVLIPNDFIDLINFFIDFLHIMDDLCLNVSNHKPVLLGLDVPSSFQVPEKTFCFV